MMEPSHCMEAALLQTGSGTNCLRDTASDNSILRLIAFVSMSLSSAEKRYSNIDRKALAILYRNKNFHHYCCFAREVSITTDHKPLVGIFKRKCSNTQKLH